MSKIESIWIEGDPFLLKAAAQRLEESDVLERYNEEPYSEENRWIHVDLSDNTWYFENIQDSQLDNWQYYELHLIFPQDWERFENAVKELESIKFIVVNNIRVVLPLATDDTLFSIEDPGSAETVEISTEEFEKLVNLFSIDESPVEFGIWSVWVDQVNIGCTKGFTREHLKEITKFLEENNRY